MFIFLLSPSSVAGKPKIVSAKLCASLEGKFSQLMARNYKAKEFLERFKYEVLPCFDFEEARYPKKIARTVKTTGIDQCDHDAWDAFMTAKTLTKGTKDYRAFCRRHPLVYGETGLLLTRKKQACW